MGQALPAGDSLWASSSESAKTSASSWSDMSVNSVRSMRSKWTSREDTLLKGSAEKTTERMKLLVTGLCPLSDKNILQPLISSVLVWEKKVKTDDEQKTSLINSSFSGCSMSAFQVGGFSNNWIQLKPCWSCICFISFLPPAESWAWKWHTPVFPNNCQRRGSRDENSCFFVFAFLLGLLHLLASPSVLQPSGIAAPVSVSGAAFRKNRLRRWDFFFLSRRVQLDAKMKTWRGCEEREEWFAWCIQVSAEKTGSAVLDGGSVNISLLCRLGRNI